jgi:hypothetical protein
MTDDLFPFIYYSETHCMIPGLIQRQLIVPIYSDMSQSNAGKLGELPRYSTPINGPHDDRKILVVSLFVKQQTPPADTATPPPRSAANARPHPHRKDAGFSPKKMRRLRLLRATYNSYAGFSHK